MLSRCRFAGFVRSDGNDSCLNTVTELGFRHVEMYMYTCTYKYLDLLNFEAVLIIIEAKLPNCRFFNLIMLRQACGRTGAQQVGFIGNFS